MQSKGRDLQGFAVLLLALLGGGFLLLRNMQPAATFTISGPASTATQPDSAWEQVIQEQLINGSTPVPTRELPVVPIVPPTLPPVTGTAVLLQPTQVARTIIPTQPRVIPITPTRPGPTAVPSPTGQLEIVANNNPFQGQFSPPPEQVPLSKNPHDHFWFSRPVDSSSNSTSIGWYPYGSDGPQNDWRIHHGLDMPNPIGQRVFAAGPGRVIWASDKYLWREDGVPPDKAYTYGNVVVIEHDFGYEGQRVYTLYAHLVAFLVKVNDRVQKGDVVGLSGASGQVSGPHVHFEVRVGRNNYYTTRNPILWMAPYLDHGVIAGRVVYRNGAPVEDATVSLIRPQTGRVIDSTSTYVHAQRPGSSVRGVNPDEYWNENFAFGDVPAGDYVVAVNINGVRLTKDVTVVPGTTSFVDLGRVPNGSATPEETPVR
jgi:murein DD-endopeptidase MepM/ murein hydrolase activator NlpD